MLTSIPIFCPVRESVGSVVVHGAVSQCGEMSSSYGID